MHSTKIEVVLERHGQVDTKIVVIKQPYNVEVINIAINVQHNEQVDEPQITTSRNTIELSMVVNFADQLS